jgi:hypothetical protein
MRRFLLLLAILVPLLPGQPVSDAERQRFEQIKAKHDSGQPVTADERQFAQRVMERMNQTQAAARNQDWAKAHPPRESTGLLPLPDLASGSYHGEEGGLYPGGKNVPPPAHLAAGLALAKRVVPLDRDGLPDDGGRIVLLSIGMSNTTQEFSAFQKLAADAPGLNPKLALVDGAQGGQTAQITANPQSNFWRVVEQRLAEAGVTPAQVEAVWLKQANAQPSAGFPADAKKLEADVVATLHNLHDRFPNLKLCYLSSRIYGGYAVTPLNPEPYAYEGGFAMKWAIADQIAGTPDLNFDPARGAVRAPWIAWGPYLWSDGVKGRKLDDLVYTRDDLGPDGTHPSDAGRRKVARQLLDFLKTDPTAKGWFLR